MIVATALAMKSRIAIIADTFGDAWGGSDELWSQTAIRLAAEGVSVAASIYARCPLHDRVIDLMDSEVKISLRSESNSLFNRMRRRLLSGRKSDSSIEIERFLQLAQP